MNVGNLKALLAELPDDLSVMAPDGDVFAEIVSLRVAEMELEEHPEQQAVLLEP